MPDPMPQDAPVPRVTLTRAAILSARTILITITGAAKRELLEGAIEDGQSSKLPIGRLLAEVEQPIDIHWAPCGRVRRGRRLRPSCPDPRHTGAAVSRL